MRPQDWEVQVAQFVHVGLRGVQRDDMTAAELSEWVKDFGVTLSEQDISVWVELMDQADWITTDPYEYWAAQHLDDDPPPRRRYFEKVSAEEEWALDAADVFKRSAALILNRVVRERVPMMVFGDVS